MPKRKAGGKRYSIHFTLRGEVDEEQAAWERLEPMLDSGEASAWLRAAVVEKLKAERGSQPARPKSLPVRTNGKVQEARYEDVEE